MGKIIFADNTEMEISDIAQYEDALDVTVDTSDVNAVIDKFRDANAVSVMRYYAGLDLIRGYAGYTKLQRVSFTPDVVVDVDYATTDPTTDSGFSEHTTDKCVVTMSKTSMLASVARQTAQNTANIDYLAMETGTEL